jgi:hypothetical protein
VEESPAEGRFKVMKRTRGILFLAPVGAIALAGCGGGDDFKNDPRPAVTIQLSGVITDKRMEVQPSRIGAGPIILLISNQTDASHSVTLEGEGVTPEEVGPINPLDTATIQATLPEGDFEIAVVESEDDTSSIDAATLEVDGERPSGSNTLLLP